MYLMEFLNDITVASIIPTRKACVNDALNTLNVSQAKVIVELGPGNGVFTKRLLQIAPADCRVIAIEMNKNLASELRSAISDSRLEVIEQSASDLGQILIERKIQSVDFIISGIPFSLMSKIDKRNLCVEAARFLSVKGTLVIYQARFPGGQFLVEKTIRPWFQVKRSRAMMFNLPPLYVLEAKLRTTLSV